ncbi:MAG: Amino-acid acetyltransferase [Pseudomonadota bacterium]|jgi:amino-acid N-acetyltransferase
MSIRKATSDDIPGIKALIAANPQTILPRSDEEMAALIEGFWVAEHNGQVVGCCCLEVYSPKIAEIRTVIVHESVRGMGLGAQLVKAAADEAEHQNIREVMVVTSSPEYFTKLGFGECLHEKWALFYRGSKGSKQ